MAEAATLEIGSNHDLHIDEAIMSNSPHALNDHDTEETKHDDDDSSNPITITNLDKDKAEPDNNSNDTPSTQTTVTTSSLSASDLQELPEHQRAAAFSQSKIEVIAEQIVDTKPSTHTLNEAEEESKHDSQHKQTITQIKVNHGHCSQQGMRATMEDQIVIQSNFTVIGSKCTSGYLSLYGVFDGHGGQECAKFCADNLERILKRYVLESSSVAHAFESAIAELDTAAIEYAKDASGSTCCIVLIDNRTFDLWCCNVGDSRCILVNGACSKFKQLSVEHKPDHPLEKQRIEAATGWVTFGRVCGILAVSRSLGDKDFKYEIENLIISTPDVTHHKVTLNEDKYIILACDGLYDVFTNKQCMEWLRKNTSKSHDNVVQKLTEKLCHDTIYVRKSKDNVSILIMRIDHHQVEIVSSNEDNDQESEVETNDNENEHDANDKMYSSTSSHGSVHTGMNDSLQSHLSNGSNASQGDAQNHTQNKPASAQKKRFHVAVASDDGVAENDSK